MTIRSSLRHLCRASAVCGVLSFLALIWVAASLCAAQEQLPPKSVDVPGGAASRPTFRAQTKLVTVRFTFHPSGKQRRLESRDGAELSPDDIEILDNGVPQRVAVLQRLRTQETARPTDVILLFDCRQRFKPYIDPDAIDFDFLDELKDVRLSIYGFSNFARRLVRPTRDPALLTVAMADLLRIPNEALGDTDPIMQTIEDSVSTPGSWPRMLIIYSGAVTRACQLANFHYDEEIRLAREHDIALFPVAVQPQTPSVPPASVPGANAIRRPIPSSPGFVPTTEFLKLGPRTGGKAFARFVSPRTILEEALKYVRSRALTEYSAGFYLAEPSGSGTTPHRIEVRLTSNIGEITGGVRESIY